ncbi:hypothetical protein [Methanobacterium paludis]|uniref:Uncharacterized protein n=1 Tax=Methanobacterium paludis (strain DSM 25820 / JCM 18151 / SWAN1) TaxID=868131 RepID=F6D1R9_METPW|nr:hypothetical protein [Methanobacterium paludis]AEG17872.1 hypothetical protein MSWAN_0845 [Methanobacterium paludis]
MAENKGLCIHDTIPQNELESFKRYIENKKVDSKPNDVLNIKGCLLNEISYYDSVLETIRIYTVIKKINLNESDRFCPIK